MLQLQSSPLSFTHSELVRRMQVHRGVFCQRGLLRPSLSTVYHCCPAEFFNKQLPLSYDEPTAGYLSPQLMHQHGETKCYRDLQSLYTAVAPQHVDPRATYVLQIELDLLTSPVVSFTSKSLNIHGPVNAAAITRVWLAKREVGRDGSLGRFLSVRPPTGVPDS